MNGTMRKTFPLMKRLFFTLLVFSFVPVFILAAERTSSGKAVVLTVNGVINPVSSEYISTNLKKANEESAEVVVIELDTPGGLDTSMRDIIKEIMASKVPVVVYVAPGGARAASAGAFITISAHVAAMAPGTNIGAAHPVNLGGQMDKTMAKKVENDSAAFIRSLAQKRGRNVDWAESAVRKSESIPEDAALKEHVIDIVASNLPDLLDQMDGRTVTTEAGEAVLQTRSAEVVRIPMTTRQQVLDALANPNVAYVLMMLGFYGLIFELSNPGSILPGVIGAICLILAFYSLQTLPINYAGVLLIVLSIILFIAEVKIASFGLLTVGGIVSLVLGSLMLIDSPEEYMRVSLTVILPVALATGLFFFFVVGAVIRTYRRKVSTGKEGLIGSVGIARTDIAPEGQIFIHGETWTAIHEERPIPKGSKVVVKGIKGLSLLVSPEKE